MNPPAKFRRTALAYFVCGCTLAALAPETYAEDDKPPRVVFDPGHPDADAQGYVAYPNVNPITEMVDLMTATRAYEANVAAINATKRVLEAALSIGRP